MNNMDLQTWILIIAVSVIIIGSLILFFKFQKTLVKILLIIVALILIVASYFFIMNWF